MIVLASLFRLNCSKRLQAGRCDIIPDCEPTLKVTNIEMSLMTGEQIELVKRSFDKLAPISRQAAALFYARLFYLDPALRGLFKGDMREQERKLMQMIALAVENLERADTLLPTVRALGARHAAYGVEEHHYETVGAAFLWTLEKALRKDFNARTRDAWTAVFGLLAETMKEGARQDAKNKAVV